MEEILKRKNNEASNVEIDLYVLLRLSRMWERFQVWQTDLSLYGQSSYRWGYSCSGHCSNGQRTLSSWCDCEEGEFSKTELRKRGGLYRLAEKMNEMGTGHMRITQPVCLMSCFGV